MFQSRNDKIDRLESKVNALTKGHQTGERIELLEALIPAEMAAVESLHRVCGVDPARGESLLRAKIEELRRLTMDDDAQWAERFKQLKLRSARLQGAAK